MLNPLLPINSKPDHMWNSDSAVSVNPLVDQRVIAVVDEITLLACTTAGDQCVQLMCVCVCGCTRSTLHCVWSYQEHTASEGMARYIHKNGLQLIPRSGCTLVHVTSPEPRQGSERAVKKRFSL